ncbi:amino acid permease-domain-containing protein [Gloeopeniophorella convolvens]|nr:amino acid permease-domain-containing protein [Gloeopeniophorella convolvens]
MPAIPEKNLDACSVESVREIEESPTCDLQAPQDNPLGVQSTGSVGEHALPYTVPPSDGDDPVAKKPHWEPAPPARDDTPRKPPSFAQSELHTIVRRQRRRRSGDDLKLDVTHPRRPHVTPAWEFSGWGSMRYLSISSQELKEAEERTNAPRQLLRHIAAMSVSGNDMVGSVFYAFPLVAASAGIYSPICLLTASLLLVFLRPLLLELASTVHINGSNYVYLLQFSGRTLSLIGAAATLLDAIATSTVSAATASAYLSAETHLPMSAPVLTILFLVVLGVVAVAGIKENASITAAVFMFHARILIMATLIVASIVHWGVKDPHSTTLKDNWSQRPSSAIETTRAIFYGICIAFLGVTGFECTPSYIEMMKSRTYASVVRNLIIITAFLNTVLSLLVWSLLPASTILGGANLLSVLGRLAGGSWLRILVLVDAIQVLLGGVLTGSVTATQLFDRLSRDHVLPSWFSLKLPVTGSHYVATLVSLGLSLLLFVASGMNLSTVSSMFSVSFLFELFLYALSTLLLKLNRPRLSRPPHAGMFTLLMAFVVVIVTWAGNVALNPTALAVFAASFLCVLGALLAIGAQPSILRLALRFYAASPLASWAVTRGWQSRLVSWYQSRRAARTCVWIKDDDIHTMLQALLSVQKNAPDARTVVFVHAYHTIDAIPSELHPNARLLDEAFPTITIDLAFVSGTFGPALVEATSHTLNIPRSRMCAVSLSREHPWELAAYGGMRVIM